MGGVQEDCGDVCAYDRGIAGKSGMTVEGVRNDIWGGAQEDCGGGGSPDRGIAHQVREDSGGSTACVVIRTV